MSKLFKNIILVGSGGLASEIIGYIKDIIQIQKLNRNNDIRLLGISDDYCDPSSFQELDGIKFLGREKDIKESENNYFLISSGKAKYRKESYLNLKKYNRNIYTLIHPSAYIANNAEIGEGSIICPNVIINSKSDVGKASLINVFSSVGHHSKVGNFTVLSPYCSMSGYSSVGESSFLGTRATVFPKIKLGDSCIVDSHTYVKSNVEDNTIVSLRSDYQLIKNRLHNNHEK